MNVSSKNKYKQRAKEGLVAYNKKLQRWINVMRSTALIFLNQVFVS